MLLPRFQVHRANTLEEALSLKSDLGDDAAFYAGGTELLLVMKLGLAEYGHLINLKWIEGMGEITSGESTVSIGALVTHDRVGTDAIVSSAFPELGEMARKIGNSRVRNAGTIGGNLAFGDPHSDPATFLTAVGGIVNLTNVSGEERAVAAASFTLAPYMTVLEEDEIIRSVDVPIPDPETTIIHRHFRFRERPALTITVAAKEKAGTVSVAVGSVVPVPIRLSGVEELVAADPAVVSHEAIKAAAAAAIAPLDDLDGSADYKQAFASEMVARAVMSALQRRSEGEPWT